ncbi:sensor histidine kinase [Sphingomonas jatrophae]|uniref:histidine kinase n=1 Tax=Sphingomonas jatrophae TaxID=1166337 RepID=A0A1I6LEY1_9SPHN|nr:HAMP domain-containing sensor histidine kinase [Sphingomonas jatrophae]SFS02002.1 Signal transduction histidine kinase [Sphingomonas jatrophae]
MTLRTAPTTVRVALLAALLALATSLTLLGFIYWRMHDDALTTLRAQVAEESRVLAEVSRAGGVQALAAAVAGEAAVDDPALIVLLLDRAGRRLAGSPLPAPAARLTRAGGFRIVAVAGGEAGVIARPVAGGWLIAGRRFGERLAWQRTLERSLGLAVLLAGVLGAGCGLIVARYVGSRVAAITAAVDRVGAGAMDGRVPLAGSRDAFDALALRINRMLDRIGSLMAELRLLTDGLAHDLRSPIGRLRTRVERALASDDPATRDQLLPGVLAEADALTRILTNVLDIGRMEAGARPMDPLDPAALVADVAEVYAPTLEDAGLALAIEVDDALPPVAGQRQLLAQALSNLVDNALTYAAEGRRLCLFAHKREGGVALGVADAGPGIPPALHGEARRRFGRLDAARSAPGGAGLGLALVDAVARHHGGRLELSDAQPGLIATLLLPASGPPLDMGRFAS